MTASQREATAAAVAAVRDKLGLTGRPPADWGNDERVDYNIALANYMLQKPELYSAAQIENAERVSKMNRSNAYLETYTLGDMVGDFASEAGKQAKEMGKIGIDLGGKAAALALLGVALYFTIVLNPKRFLKK